MEKCQLNKLNPNVNIHFHEGVNAVFLRVKVKINWWL